MPKLLRPGYLHHFTSAAFEPTISRASSCATAHSPSLASCTTGCCRWIPSRPEPISPSAKSAELHQRRRHENERARACPRRDSVHATGLRLHRWKIAAQDVPLAHQYGVSDERANEIIGWALLADMADRAMSYRPPSAPRPATASSARRFPRSRRPAACVNETVAPRPLRNSRRCPAK